jgi:hypothetical protein
MSGFHTACAVGAAICLAGALGALALPGRQKLAEVVVPELEPVVV